ncbi:MAG: hypothetical protein ACYCX7_05735, partial [Solirubrobacteraceae bacterium]
LLAGAGFAGAATVTFGSPLSVPASHTTDELNYVGAEPVAGLKVNHAGADTALWTVTSPAGAPTSPGSGEIVKLELEGCVERAAGAPPLSKEQREVHFQNLREQAGGSFKAESTSSPFEMPVCGEGASASTVSTITPAHFCIATGEYIDFNDSGWFSAPYYYSGVPYRVIGSVSGAKMDSFVSTEGAGTGAIFSPSMTNPNYGFASNANDELMIRATLNTAGSYFCPGSEPPAPPEKSSGGGGSGKTPPPPKPAKSVLKLGKRSEKVKKGLVAVPVSCVGKAVCDGTLVLKAKAAKGGVEEIGHKPIKLAGGQKKIFRVKLDVLGRKRVKAAAGKRFDAAVTLRAASGEPAKVGTLVLK